MYSQGNKHFLFTGLVDSAEIWYAISGDIIWHYNIDQTNEQVLAILRPLVRKVGAEWVEDQKVFIWSVEEWLTQYSNDKAKQIDPILIINIHIMVHSCWNTNAIPPNEILIDAIVLWRLTIGKRLYGKSFFEKEHTNWLHHVDSIDLGIEKSLFAPHASNKEILFFKKQWEYPVQYVNGSFYFLYKVFILEDLVLCSCVVHDFNALKTNKKYS